MAQTASSTCEGVTFGPGQEDIAERVQAAEHALWVWTCGGRNAKQVRDILRANGVHLLDRLNPNGSNRIDAEVDGYGTLTLTF